MKRILLMLCILVLVFAIPFYALTLLPPTYSVTCTDIDTYKTYIKNDGSGGLQGKEVLLPAAAISSFGTFVKASFLMGGPPEVDYYFKDDQGREYELNVIAGETDVYGWAYEKKTFSFSYGGRRYALKFRDMVSNWSCACPDGEPHNWLCRLRNDETEAEAFEEIKTFLAKTDPPKETTTYITKVTTTPKVTTPTATTTTPPPQAPASNPWKYWVAPAGVLLLVGGIACGVYLKRKRK